jgi:hypothetical protein
MKDPGATHSTLRALRGPAPGPFQHVTGGVYSRGVRTGSPAPDPDRVRASLE